MILWLLLVDVGLKTTNITVQVISIMEFVYFEVPKVVSIHIPFGGSQSTFRCMLGVELRGCGQQEVTVGIVTNAFTMKCLELVHLVLDLP